MSILDLHEYKSPQPGSPRERSQKLYDKQEGTLIRLLPRPNGGPPLALLHFKNDEYTINRVDIVHKKKNSRLVLRDKKVLSDLVAADRAWAEVTGEQAHLEGRAAAEYAHRTVFAKDAKDGPGCVWRVADDTIPPDWVP